MTKGSSTGESRVARWIRDARHASRRLRGLAAPPVQQTRTVNPLRVVPRVQKRVAIVKSIAHPTRDAVTLTLSLAGDPLHVTAGQFVTLSLEIGGKTQRRNYSIACADGALGSIDVTVKRVANGVVSNHIVEHVRVGDSITVEGPHGSFTRQKDHAGALVFIAAGSGITPIFSLIASTLRDTPDARVALVFANRSSADVIFGEAIAALARRHQSFSVTHVLDDHDATDVAADPSIIVGRLDEDVIARVLDVPHVHALTQERDAHFFVCGPPAVRENVRKVLASRAVDSARIFEERYTHATENENASTEPARVTFVARDKKQIVLTLAPGETLLEGATRAGMKAPFSCGMGGCGECKMHLVSGAVAMEEPNCLFAEERERGEILACVARAVSSEDGVVVEVRS